MRIILIGDDESSILFHLIGIESEIAEENPDLFKTQLLKIIDNPTIGIILITENTFVKHKDIIIPLKMKIRQPIIVEVPDMMQKFKEEYINEIYSKSIGI